MVDDTAGGVDGVANPARVPKRRHVEFHVGLEGLVDPLAHPVLISLHALLDDRVEAEGLGGELACAGETLFEAVAVDVGEGERLYHPQGSSLAHRGAELRVAAWIHRTADQGDLDTGVFCEGCLEGVHGLAGPRIQVTEMEDTTSPDESRASAVAWNSVFSVRVSGGEHSLVTSSRPRAFLW